MSSSLKCCLSALRRLESGLKHEMRAYFGHPLIFLTTRTGWPGPHNLHRLSVRQSVLCRQRSSHLKRGENEREVKALSTARTLRRENPVPVLPLLTRDHWPTTGETQISGEKRTHLLLRERKWAKKSQWKPGTIISLRFSYNRCSSFITSSRVISSLITSVLLWPLLLWPLLLWPLLL